MATEEKLFKLYNRRKYKWAGGDVLFFEGYMGPYMGAWLEVVVLEQFIEWVV